MIWTETDALEEDFQRREAGAELTAGLQLRMAFRTGPEGFFVLGGCHGR
jgi:hypothetical protein